MALSASTFTFAGGAVSDLFASGAADYKAQGYGLQALSYDDQIASLGLRQQSLGIQAASYDSAAALAARDAELTRENTGLQLMQLKRKEDLTQGSARAAIAGLGFANSGSALDILADNAGQASLEQQAAVKQGLISEGDYQLQSQSYKAQASAARLASAEAGNSINSARLAQQGALLAQSAAEDESDNAGWMSALKGAATIATLFI